MQTFFTVGTVWRTALMQRGFARHRAHQFMLGVAGVNVLENIILAVGDRGDFDDLAIVFGNRMAGEFAEGSFLAADVGQNLAFDHHFRVGGNQDRHGLGFHHAQRFVHHAADNRVLVLRRRRQRLRAERKERMNADDDGDGKGLVAAFQFVVQGPEMPADGHENAQLALARHHQPVVAGVSHAGVRIGGDDDAGSDIGSGVDVIVGQQRHFCQINFIAEP